MESIHIQLSHEGSVVVVFEQLRDQRAREFIFVDYDERVAVVGPSNEILVLVVVEKAVLC